MLLKAVLVSSFGRGSARPARAALIRLGGLGAGALALGLLFAQGAQGLQLAPVLDGYALFFSCLMAVQLVMLATLLSGQPLLDRRGDTMGRWLRSLPLDTFKRAGLLLLPIGLLTGCSLLLVLPPVAAVAAQLGLPPLLVGIGAMLGVASAFGLVLGLQGGWRTLIIPAVIWVEYKYRIPWLQGVLVTGLVGLGAHRLLDSVRFAPRPNHNRGVHTAWLPPLLWFVKKMFRSRPTGLAFITNLSLSAGLAVFSYRQSLTDPAALGLFGALLAGSFCSDVRGLAKRHRPAEITSLRGTLRFAGAELATAALSGMVIALPLALCLQQLPAQFIAQIVLGISLGFLAGTVLVPEARDMLSQFLALLLILALLVALPQLGLFAGNWVAHTGSAALIVTAAVWLELKRNNYIWRNERAK